MMSKFAKLFDMKNGDQVLIFLVADANQRPVMHVKTSIGSAFVEATVDGYSGNHEEQWAKADDALNQFDWLAANKYYESIPDITEPA